MGPGDRDLRGPAGQTVTDPTASIPKAPLWERHRGLLIGLTVFVVLLITVVSDLPVSTSRADEINAERSVMSEVNTDLAGCALVGWWQGLPLPRVRIPQDHRLVPGAGGQQVTFRAEC